MESQVDEAVKKNRLAALQELLNVQQSKFNAACVGNELDVLLDGHGRHSGQLIGRSPYMQAVHVSAPSDLIGSIVTLRIDEAHPNSLAASVPEKRQTQRAIA